MDKFRPWDGTVRLLTGGWLSSPQHRGERFAESEPVPTLSVSRYRSVFAFLLLIALWLPRHITR